MRYWKTMALSALLVPAVGFAQQAEEEQFEEQDEQLQQQEMEEQAGMDEMMDEEAFKTEQEEGQIVTDNLIGSTVTDAEGQEIGTVQDLLISEEGEVEGVILGVGGFAGIGEKNVALAWDEVQMQQDPQDPQSYQVQVDMDQQAIEDAPEFVMRDEQEEGEEQQQ